MKKNILLIAALLGAMTWTGCMKEELVPEDPEELTAAADSVWTLTLQAAKQDAPETKGLAIEGEEATTTAVKSIWKENETVQVYLGTTRIGYLTADPDDGDAHKATLSGTVTTTNLVANESKLTLITPGTRYGGEPETFTWDYTGQVGKLLIGDDAENSIEKKFHYTLAGNVTVTAVDTEHSTITTEDATFRNQQSIYRMNFRYLNPGSTKQNITAKSVTITSASGHLVQSQAVDGSSVVEGAIDVTLGTASAEPFFVALRNGDVTNEEALTFTVIDADGVTYRGSKTIPAEYKPNGTFVSIKNATLNDRLGVELSATTVATVW